MDWKEDIMTNIYVFPRGIQRMGHNKEKTVNWTSKYGSVIATGYDIGTCDGMNEKGLVASLLFLPESIYSLPGDTRPAMGISIWTQYVLDNFATVREAVDELKKETFRIDAPRMPNGGPESTHPRVDRRREDHADLRTGAGPVQDLPGTAGRGAFRVDARRAETMTSDRDSSPSVA